MGVQVEVGGHVTNDRGLHCRHCVRVSVSFVSISIVEASLALPDPSFSP